MHLDKSDIGQAIADLDPLILALIKRRLPQLHQHERDDVAQDLRLHLWLVLPQHDPRRGSIGAFARACLLHAITDMSRRNHRQISESLLPVELTERTITPDFEGHRLSMELRSNPEAFLPPSLVRVLRALQHYPTPGAAAQSLGLKPRAFWSQAWKLKDCIREIFETGNTRSDLPQHNKRCA